MNTFFECLFDPKEATCFTVSPRGTRISDVEWTKNSTEVAYFSINPIHPTRDLKPTEEWHRYAAPVR